MKRRRQFWIREIKDFMGMPGLNVYDTDLKCGDIHVREVLPGEDEMIKELVEAIESYRYNFESVEGCEQCDNNLAIIQSLDEALDKYKKWVNEK